MTLAEYLGLFVVVITKGGGLPALGDAALIAAGTLAGEGRLNVVIVATTGIVAWMLGSLAGYWIGIRGGRRLLEHPGRLETSRLKVLAKGDRIFGRHNFIASLTMPSYVSGIFRVSFGMFVLGAATSGFVLIGLYVGVSYFLGADIAERIGTAGARALLGVLVVVAIGLGIRAALAKWRAVRRARSLPDRQR